MNTAYLIYQDLDAPSIFVRAWVRLVNWRGHRSNVNKFMYVEVHDAPCNTPRPWYLYFEGQEPARIGVVGQCSAELDSRYSGPGMAPDRWIEVAWQIDRATDDTGRLQAWADGAQAMDVSRQTANAGYGLNIKGLHGAPVWGGIGETIQVAQYMDIAAIEIWVPGG